MNKEINQAVLFGADNQTTIGVVGLGVMGASFGARLRQAGYRVLGFDLTEQIIMTARELQVIDEGTIHPEELLNQCDVLIFCLYPQAIAGYLQKYGKDLKDGVLIMEISGVKSSVVPGIEASLPANARFVSIHPMCGRESKGIAYSTPAIFLDANFLIIESEKTTEQDMREADAMARQLGCRRISRLSMEEHDTMIAFLSQLTHVIAVSLMNTHENSHLVEFTGDSFRDLTRIAKINEEMWSELFVLNKPLLLDEIRQFEDSLDNFKKALEAEDKATMKSLFIQSTERRKKFDR